MRTLEDVRKVLQDLLAPELRVVAARFDVIDQRFDAFSKATDARFEAMSSRFDAVDTKFASLEKEIVRVRKLLYVDLRDDFDYRHTCTEGKKNRVEQSKKSLEGLVRHGGMT